MMEFASVLPQWLVVKCSKVNEPIQEMLSIALIHARMLSGSWEGASQLIRAASKQHYPLTPPHSPHQNTLENTRIPK